MDNAAVSVKDQLQHSDVAFIVQYIGFVEVVTPFHEIKKFSDKRLALCQGCASLIAQAANLISKNPLNSEIQNLIGENEPKIFNKEIELTVTKKVIRLSSINDRNLFKKIEVETISTTVILPTVGETLKNGFVFIGKIKNKMNELKRFCFLLQSPEDPKNINFAFTAISKRDKSLKNNENEANGFIAASAVPQEYNEGNVEEENSPQYSFLPFSSRENGETQNPVQPELSLFDDFTPPGNLYQKTPRATNDDFGEDSTTSILASINTLLFNACTEEKFEQICADIEQFPNFFGGITRVEAEDFLKTDGSYLIRFSESRPFTVVLSLRHENRFHHLLLNDENGNVTSGSRCFVSIYDLMVFHARKNLPFIIDGTNAIKLCINYPSHL